MKIKGKKGSKSLSPAFKIIFGKTVLTIFACKFYKSYYVI